MLCLNAALPLRAPFRFWLFQAKQETLIISISVNSEASKTKIVSSDPLRRQRELWERNCCTSISGCRTQIHFWLSFSMWWSGIEADTQISKNKMFQWIPWRIQLILHWKSSSSHCGSLCYLLFIDQSLLLTKGRIILPPPTQSDMAVGLAFGQWNVDAFNFQRLNLYPSLLQTLDDHIFMQPLKIHHPYSQSDDWLLLLNFIWIYYPLINVPQFTFQKESRYKWNFLKLQISKGTLSEFFCISNISVCVFQHFHTLTSCKAEHIR